MESTARYKIICNHISALDGNSFQDLCDRLCLKLYPDDYNPVRAGGPKGDMKNDGYCPKTRIYFAAHATIGETISATKAKIKKDLEGCLKHHNDVLEWIFLTNITLVGEVQTFIDEKLRTKYTSPTIDTWDHKRLSDKINQLSEDDIEFVIDMALSDCNFSQNNTHTGGTQINAQGNHVNQYISVIKDEEKDFGILQEIIDYMMVQSAEEKKSNASSPTGDLTKLKTKIDKNFKGQQKITVDEVVLRTWGKRNLVQKFVQMQTSLDESRIDDVILKIQSDYRKAKGNVPNHQIAVEDYSILEEIAQNYIQDTKKSNPSYISNSIAIVLYFFELCNFGKK